MVLLFWFQFLSGLLLFSNIDSGLVGIYRRIPLISYAKLETVQFLFKFSVSVFNDFIFNLVWLRFWQFFYTNFLRYFQFYDFSI